MSNRPIAVMDHSYRIRPLEEHDAREILRWRYPEPYDFYDPPVDDHGDHYVSQFLKPEYQFHAIVDERESFIGFCSYGIDGQVPGGNYTEEALDIGLGMKPGLTGQGRGKAFFSTIVDHACDNLNPDTIRLTVACFNARAMKLYENFGFIKVDEFMGSLSNVPYSILVYSNIPEVHSE